MKALQDIHSEYRKTVSLLREAPFRTDISCLVSASLILPGFFRHHVSESGRSREDYHCFGSYRGPDRTFARMPWVSCRVRGSEALRKGGYAATLLFREDMAGCWLSLNRGYELHKRMQRGERVDRLSATPDIAALVGAGSVPAPWIIGPIDLGATTGFSRCHEVGAAISRYYGAAQPPTESEFAQAFLQLMDWYDRLAE